MSKKLFFIIIILIILVGGIASYFAYRKQNNPATDTGSGTDLAFGNQTNSANTSNGDTSGQGSIDLGNGQGNQNAIATPTSTTTPPTLEIISLNTNGEIIPVTGATVIQEKATSSIVRYMERGTGHIYDRSFSSSTPFTNSIKISNTTLPRIYEALFTPNGNGVYTRYTDSNDSIATFYGTITTSTSTPEMPGDVDGAFLSSGIDELLVGESKIFTLQNIAGEGSGIISNFDGSKKTQIFDSPLTEWLAEWPKEDTITLTTKASASAPGFLFFMKTANGSLQKVLASLDGLTTLTSKDTSYVLYSEATANDFDLKILNTKTGEKSLAPTKTLPEKCVWSKISTTKAYCLSPRFITRALYPDNWYQGVVSFTDDIWSLDVKTGEARILASAIDMKGKEIDGVKPFLNQKEDHLFFTNKKDFTLWSLKLN